jgi:drug/metabolite transporter (DMT)-like permease
LDVEELKILDHKKKVRIGLLMGVLCALYWGIWYAPGYAVWNMDILTELDVNLAIHDPNISYEMASTLECIFLTGFNAIFCAAVLFIWNGGLRKLPEFKRELVQVKGASKYFMMAGICGACAVSGTYLAANNCSPGFAAIAGLLYPIIGTIMSALYLKQKVSKRGYLAVVVLLVGGITLYAGSLITGGVAGAGNTTIGLIGGIMAAVGWGFEGVCAGKALDFCEPDIGLHLRFCFEAIFWIIVMVIIACTGIPIFSTVGKLLDPATFFAFLLLGLSFAWCYVTWYKSFPLLGVARGQAVGSLYAACAVIFLCVFFGPAAALNYDDDSMLIIVGSTILGLIICLIGSFLLASEDTEGMVSLREHKGGDER